MSEAVSVVMPAYQAEATVGAAVSSVLAQSHQVVEVVVVDDGSTDRTAEVAAGLGDAVRVVDQPHTGVAAARNRGVSAARSPLVACCDADDRWLPNHLELLLTTLRRDRRGIAAANAWIRRPGAETPDRRLVRGPFPTPERQRMAILQMNFVPTMALFERSLFEEIGPYDESLSRAEDWDFWLRAIFAGRVAHLQPEPTVVYRLSPSSLTAAEAAMDRAEESVLRKASLRPDLTTDERAYLERRLSGPGPAALGREADEALRDGRWWAAARLYRRAASLCPDYRPLVTKARLMSIAPPLAGRIARRRLPPA